MAGIYVHIPFCKQACHYCNFHFSTSMKHKNGFLPALLNEIVLQNNFLGNQSVETIYFGGGTPSLLSADEISLILESLRTNFLVAPDAEITIEANPDDITPEKLNAWSRMSINRLSIGIQSFFEADLKWMNRAHNASQAEQCVQWAKEAGFDNLTIDLIFGTPTLTDANWLFNVQKAISLEIPHLSCYALTIEPRTPLEKMIRKKTAEGVNADDQARQFLLLMDWLNNAGYEQYEISNYSLPGKHSKHNSSYWQGKQYLGLGPSAHSFNGDARQWNVSNNALYIQSLQKNIIPFEIELLTPVQRLNEWVMTSLRTKEGLQLNQLPSGFGKEIISGLRKKCIIYQQQNLVQETEHAFILTREGKLFADGIAAGLFFEESEINEDVFVAGSLHT
ncbi:MAG: radical SAM family heme chaperone HemW [Chitinophagaceae bacterium]|nr:radical SAM family heme chaperone HemW [Chitinophagaceae bacterium]